MKRPNRGLKKYIRVMSIKSGDNYENTQREKVFMKTSVRVDRTVKGRKHSPFLFCTLEMKIIINKQYDSK
jgi:hypothetical protein